MTLKKYTIHFAQPKVGTEGVPMAAALRAAHAQHGQHLPAVDLGGDGFQMRELQRIGTVWRGVFARLRDDAPHIVNGRDQEREIPLDDGDRILDKCHFLYRERDNVLVWQVNRNAGGLVRVQQCLSQVFGDFMDPCQVMNEAELQRVLDGRLYEISFGYARPNRLDGDAPAWNQHTFALMSNVHAAQAKFELRAPRGGGLADAAKRMVRQLMGAAGVKKIRVRLTDESNPVELFMAPLRDTVAVNLAGRYPVVQEIYQALEEAYDRQQGNIPGLA